MKKSYWVPGLLIPAVLLLLSCSSTDPSEDPNGEESSSSLSSSSVSSSSSEELSSSVSSSSSEESSSSVSSSSSEELSSSSSSSSVESSGTVTDARDGKTYNWVRIGDQIWMAENLNFGSLVAGTANQKDAAATDVEKYCYNNDESNCDTFGGLYQWHSAMTLPYSCNSTECSDQIESPHRGICPEGWHLPTRAEWTTFAAWVDADNGGEQDDEGISLKSLSGWSSNGINGTDTYGWNALPGGRRGVSIYNGTFQLQGATGYWWSASESSAGEAWSRYLDAQFRLLREFESEKNDTGRSVRCIKD